MFRYVAGGNNPVDDEDALALAATRKRAAPGAARLLSFLRGAVFLRLSPTTMALRGRLAKRVRGPMLDETGAGLVSLLASLSKAQRAEVSAQIAEVIGGVEGIDVVKESSAEGYYQTLERMVSRGGSRVYPVPSWLLSEGTRRITAVFALLAARPRPTMLVIEEIENGLDPWTLSLVFDALREASQEGLQVIVTTHSPFLLDHVNPREVIHVRRKRGDSVYEKLDSFKEVVDNEGVIAPGAMYIANYMGDAADE